MSRLFVAFEQLDRTTARGIEGSGLGLHLSHKLAEALSGVISVQSVLGSGSSFSVRVPDLP